MPPVDAMIGLDDAVALCDACIEAAAAREVVYLAVVVTDTGGAIRAAMRTDGQGAFAFDIAHAKAQSALGFRRSTLKLSGHFTSAASSTVGIAHATGQRFVPIGGGVVVTDGAGIVIGAIAVAGAAPQVDDALARAGLAARPGFTALD